MFSQLFNTILYNPLFNLIVVLYNLIPGQDFGVVVIVITILIKIILYPLTASSIKSQRALQELQPKIEALKAEYKNDAQKMTQATMKLYRENRVSPFSSCLPLLIQLPVLLALYYVLRDGLAGADFTRLYPFVSNPGAINSVSFGFLDLAKPSVWLAVLAGIVQFAQAKMFVRPKPAAVSGARDENMMSMMNKQMLYFMPIITVVIGAQLPGALTLYWFVSTLLVWLQQIVTFRKSGVKSASGNLQV
jgi:YidC/Oxa1 family membrane protein insertase